VRQMIWIRNGLYNSSTQGFSMWTSPAYLSESIVVRKDPTNVSDDLQQTAANHSNREPKSCFVQKPLANIRQGGDCKQNQECEVGSQRCSVAPIGVADQTSVPIAVGGVVLISAAIRSTGHLDQHLVQRRCHNEPRQKALEHRDIDFAVILGFKSSNSCSQNKQG
jgi:hypothetical protein